MIEAQIFTKQKEFDKALSVLDSLDGCTLGADCEVRDSLKIVNLILKFGKEKVKNSFSKVTSVEINKDDFFPFYSVYLKELEYNFVFAKSDDYFVDKNGKIIEYIKSGNEFLDKIRIHKYDKLLE